MSSRQTCTIFGDDAKVVIPEGTELVVAENLGLLSVSDWKFPTSVRELRFQGNRLTSWKGFPSCATRVDVSRNKLTDLVGMPADCTELRVSNNPLKSLKGCSSSLRSIGCSFTHLQSFEGCGENVTDVVAASCLISSWKGIPQKQMNKVYASYNRLKTCKSAPAARHLDISCNMLESTNGLPQAGIIELNVSNNLLRDIDFCPPTVTKLRASGNRLVEVTSLSPALELLEISKNSLRNIGCISWHVIEYGTLKELFCGENDIKQIPPFIQSIVQDVEDIDKNIKVEDNTKFESKVGPDGRVTLRSRVPLEPGDKYAAGPFRTPYTTQRGTIGRIESLPTIAGPAANPSDAQQVPVLV